MNFIVCEGQGFIATSVLEKAKGSIPINVVDLDGKTLSGKLVLVPFASEKAEMLFVFQEGVGAISAETFEVGERYNVFLSVNDVRFFAGEIRIIDDVHLGVCILPVLGDTGHLWDCFKALSGYIQILREKLDSHIDGADIV